MVFIVARMVNKMDLFNHENVNFEILKKRAYNYRWAEVEDGVIPLTAADPDFPVAKEIREVLIDYLNDGYLSYTPKLGIPEVKESLAKALKVRKNVKIDSNLILPLDSVARAMFVTAEALLNEGDEVIVFDPLDYLFNAAVTHVKAKSVYVKVKVSADRLDFSGLEAAITPKTRMITICNPHNPLGMLFTKEDLLEIIAIAKKYDLWIMNDEIWSDIVYPEQEFVSIVNLDEEFDQKIVSCYGFSKSFGIAGLRAGILYTHNQEVFDKCVEVSVVMSTAGGITSLSQIAMQTCVEKCYYWTDAFVEHLRKNRDYALERLNKMPLITCHKPYATYLLFPDISATGMSAQEFADYVLAKEKLAVVPGSVKFFGPGGEGHIRICYATSFEVLKEGLNCLEKALNGLVK